MSLESFLGTYRVATTFGTHFGLDTVVTISDDQGSIAVSFQLPGRTVAENLTASYDPATDALDLTLDEPSAQMFVARVHDVDYRAIYGVVVFEQASDPPVRRLAVWGANAIGVDVDPTAPTATDPARQTAFSGTYLVKATAGAQFGLGSTITIGAVAPDGTQSLTIVNALDQELTDTPALTYDAATGSLRGATMSKGQPVRIRMSLATIPGTTGESVTIVYGVSTVGDPEQAATWAGDDDGAG